MNLRALISQGEGERLEFKKKTTHPTRIARTLASLANTHGGQVLVGVDDDGRIVGVRDAEEEIYQLREAAQHYIDPPLELFFQEIEDGEGTVVVVTVPESRNKPHRAQTAPDEWHSYVRVHDESILASNLTEKLLERQQPEARLEKLPLNKDELRVLDYLRSHPRLTVPDCARLLNVSRRRAYRLLIKLTLHGYTRYHDRQQQEAFYTL